MHISIRSIIKDHDINMKGLGNNIFIGESAPNNIKKEGLRWYKPSTKEFHTCVNGTFMPDVPKALTDEVGRLGREVIRIDEKIDNTQRDLDRTKSDLDDNKRAVEDLTGTIEETNKKQEEQEGKVDGVSDVVKGVETEIKNTFKAKNWERKEKDGQGTFKVVKKTLPSGGNPGVVSTLSDPDSSGLYKTRTIEYGKVGDKDYKKEIYALSYDSDGDVIKQTLK